MFDNVVLNGSLNNKADTQYFLHDTDNTWIQTPFRNNKYVSRVYASFDDMVGSTLGTMLLSSDGMESNFLVASSRYGFVPMVIDSTSDLNDVLGNHFIEVHGSKNSPKIGLNFYGFNLSWFGDNRFAFQLLIAPNEQLIGGSINPRMYMRSKNEDIWTSWNVITGTLFS